MMIAGRGTTVLLQAVLVVALGLAVAGCPKQPEVGETKPAGPAVASTPPRPSAGTGATEARVTPPPAPRESTVKATPTPPGGATASPLKDVFFDYDKALLTDDAKRALNEDLAWLKGNPRAQITVEGHCDERGTAEYNLALGDRRAKAVRDYLVAAGIEASRIRIVSYGEERPFVPGHDESAWRWNRRDHFVLAR